MKDENKIWSEFWGKKESWLWILKFTPTYKKVAKMFRAIDLPKKDAKILDAGCGTGKLASFWLNEGYDVLGVDISDGALAITNKKGVKTIKADILRLPFEDNSFDLVYSDGLLEHFVNPEPVLTELFRVSNKYVLTFVPIISPLKTIIDAVVPPPKEYKKRDSEWIQLHEKFKAINIKSERLFTVLGVLCEKNA